MFGGYFNCMIPVIVVIVSMTVHPITLIVMYIASFFLSEPIISATTVARCTPISAGEMIARPSNPYRLQYLNALVGVFCGFYLDFDFGSWFYYFTVDVFVF